MADLSKWQNGISHICVTHSGLQSKPCNASLVEFFDQPTSDLYTQVGAQGCSNNRKRSLEILNTAGASNHHAQQKDFSSRCTFLLLKLLFLGYQRIIVNIKINIETSGV